MEGILRCSRYSFGPNRLHYCGPDANSELRDYINSGHTDPGLEKLLSQFETLYPYLKHISHVNNIIDPFDTKVVEAYWLGNSLLDNEKMDQLHRFLVDGLDVKKKFGNSEFGWLEGKIAQGAVPHHSFHVFNVWRRLDNKTVPQSVHNLDECRVSWGEIVSLNGPDICVKTEPLVYVGGKFALGEPILKNITRQLESEYDIEQLKVGQLVSIHWSVPCEVISQAQMESLRRYTLKNIGFANQTV